MVWDLTAGLGRDSYLLAAAGCECHLVEREPVMALLLADAILRAGEGSGPAARLRPLFADARDLDPAAVLARAAPDVLLMDPMFPPREGAAKKKRALAKKDMQSLRVLTESTEQVDVAEQAELFRKALAVAELAASGAGHGRSVKIVVKRHKNSPLVVDRAERAPANQLKGSTNRFDVYIVNGAQAERGP